MKLTKGMVVKVNGHPLIQQIIITNVVGTNVEGWINDNTRSANYFTLKHMPGAGWLANLGTAYVKKVKDIEIARMLGLV